MESGARPLLTTVHDLIDIEQLQELLAAGDCRLVDCRHDLFDPEKGRKDYLAGHIPGAVHADMDRHLAGEITPGSGRHPLPDPQTFFDTLGSWGIGNDTRVIAYDYGSSVLAVRLWWMLRFWCGHERASVLNGGIAAWTRAGGELETSEPKPARTAFAATVDEAVVATTAEISAAVQSGTTIDLIDARDAARFNGEKEPIDTVAGHIPGAVNMPLGGNLEADGRWRNPADLAAVWADIGSRISGQRPVVMCGSGVTACHLILAATLAGLEAPRLYVGSWSEWIRDPGRPVEPRN